MTRMVIVGCGAMGEAHARALIACQQRDHPASRLVGLVSRGASKARLRAKLGLDTPLFDTPLFDTLGAALTSLRPDAVCIATWPDTHEALALEAFAAGAHVLLEKPLAPTLAAARRIVAASRSAGRVLQVGYVLRHDPLWQAFITHARALGRPLVMRMALNQPSHGSAWAAHQALLASVSPLADCAVHYVDVMGRIARQRPTAVSAIAARLHSAVAQPNYGQLQLRFEDGSVGWFESGWGPMISPEPAVFFDVMGPGGSLSLRGGPGAGELLLRPREAAAGPPTVLPVPTIAWSDVLSEQMASFLRSVAADEATRHSRADAVDASSDHGADDLLPLEIALAADQAAEEGRTIRLAPHSA